MKTKTTLLALLFFSFLFGCKKEETISPANEHLLVGLWTIYVKGAAGDQYSYKIWALGIDNRIISGQVDSRYSFSIPMQPSGYYNVMFKDSLGVEQVISHSALQNGFVLISDTIPATMY